MYKKNIDNKKNSYIYYINHIFILLYILLIMNDNDRVEGAWLEGLDYKVIWDTVQLYITEACAQECTMCSSVLTKMGGNMYLEEFKYIVDNLKEIWVKRIELFANDPILHPEIYAFIEKLNESGLEYAILTVWDNVKKGEWESEWNYVAWKVRGIFNQVLEKILEGEWKWWLVFSVDYLPEEANEIVEAWDRNDPRFFPAFKAKTFWDLSESLKDKDLWIRINIVISPDNIKRVPGIARKAAEMWFAISFCYMQNQSEIFRNVMKNKWLTEKAKQKLIDFNNEHGLLSEEEFKTAMEQIDHIIEWGNNNKEFNCFRSPEPSIQISEEKLESLRLWLLELKNDHNIWKKIIPWKSFIDWLWKEHIWCIDLLKKWRFPQLKVWPWGKIYFCCDMHDVRTSSWTTKDLIDQENRKSFIDQTRKNPYILLCAALNPCSFSVNYVTYRTSNKADKAMEKTPFTPLTKNELRKVQERCDNHKKDWRLFILPETKEVDEAFVILRQDYLDNDLLLPDRAMRNIRITFIEFHYFANKIIYRLVTLVKRQEWKNIFPLYPWRAALAFLPNYADLVKDTNHLHIWIARNEDTLKPEEYLPLDLSHEWIKDWKIIISDPMLATWGSMIYIIEKLIKEWIQEENIVLACIFAAPEWVDKILTKFPNIKIYTWVLDDHLDENWFIVPWLWDFWDKWSEWVSKNYFECLRGYFTKVQFEELLKKYWFDI